MNVRLQIVIGVIIVAMIFYIANMVRRKKIDLRYTLSWMCLGVVLLLLDIFPGIMEWLADLIGIKTPSNMVFFFGFILIVILVYSLTTSVSRLSDKSKKLTQEVALLREELERLK